MRRVALVALCLAASEASQIARAGNDAVDARRRATAAAVDSIEAARRAKIIDEAAGTIAHLRGLVDRDTAQATVRKLNENPELMTALAAGGLRIDRELVCPHCIADYLRRAFTMIRDETGLGDVVDDLALPRQLARLPQPRYVESGSPTATCWMIGTLY